MEEKIRQVIEYHEAYTVIRYRDDDSRTGYQCRCGAESPDDHLWGREWLVDHVSREIVKALDDPSN